MEKTKVYRVLVEQIDRFSHEFSVIAASEVEAKSKVEKMIEDEPLDCRKNTYDTTDVAIEIIVDRIQVHTVENLFNIDGEECDQQVILLDDLTIKQKEYLGLAGKSDMPNTVRPLVRVNSTRGSLEVDATNGEVVKQSDLAGDYLNDIVRFDIDEFKRHYKVSELPYELDVVDLGYWCKDGTYYQRIEDWRDQGGG